MLINKRENVALKLCNGPTTFIENSNDIQDIYENIGKYNPNKKGGIMTACDDMMADMLRNKKHNPVLTELFIRGRKLNISLVFIWLHKKIRLNSTHYVIIKTPNKIELQEIAINHTSDIDFKDFMILYKKYTTKRYSFLVNNTTLASYNLLCFGCN